MPPEGRPGILHYKDGERFWRRIPGRRPRHVLGSFIIRTGNDFRPKFLFFGVGQVLVFLWKRYRKHTFQKKIGPACTRVHVDISQAFFGSCTRVLVCIRPGSDLQIMITGNDFGAGCRTARGIVLRYQLFQSSRREYKHRHIHVASQDVVDHHTS